RRAREAARHLARVVDAAVRIQPLAQPADMRLAVPRRQREDLRDPVPLVLVRALEQADDHQRPLALAEVALELLAVDGLVADQVQDVVLDLEGRADQKAEADEGL